MVWEKVSSGQKIKTSHVLNAAYHNDIGDTVNAFKGGAIHTPAPAQRSFTSNNLIKVKNLTGTVLARYEVVAVGDYLLNKNNPLEFRFEALAVSTTFSRRYAIMAVPLKENKTGLAYIGGMCPAKYVGATPSPGDSYGPKPANVALFANYPSIMTVFDVVDITQKIMLGSLHEINSLLCQSQADNAAGALATDNSDLKIMKGTAGSEADSGYTTVPAIYAREAISDNDFFPAKLINGLWYAVQQTGAVTMYKCKLNGRLESIDGSASINTVTAFGSGTAPSPTSAVNTLDLAGDDEDNGVIIKDGTGYYLLNVEHHACD